MSQIVAHSLAEIKLPTPLKNTQGDFDFQVALERIANRKAGGMTIHAISLKHNELFSAVCSEYKSHYQIEPKTRLSNELVDQITLEINTFVERVMNAVNKENVIRQRKYFFPDMRNKRVTVRVQNTGENLVSLKEQLCGIHLAINATSKAYDKAVLEYRNESAEKLQKRLTDLRVIEHHIQAQIATNEQLKAEIKQ